MPYIYEILESEYEYSDYLAPAINSIIKNMLNEEITTIIFNMKIKAQYGKFYGGIKLKIYSPNALHH